MKVRERTNKTVYAFLMRESNFKFHYKYTLFKNAYSMFKPRLG